MRASSRRSALAAAHSWLRCCSAWAWPWGSGLFPEYLDGTSLAAQPDNLVAHVIYLATWTTGAVLITLGGSRLRIRALRRPA